MNPSASLIFNPVAGKGSAEAELQQIKNNLSPAFDLDIQLTTKEVDADVLARECVEKGATTILVSGGDGTLSTAANALINTDIRLGVIPRGTANAFALAVGIPTDIEGSCRTILAEASQRVDVARSNGKPTILLSGIGFEADTVKNTTRTAKNRLGSMAYFVSAIGQLWNFSKFEAKIETEEEAIATEAAAISVANAAPPTSVLAQGPAGIIYDDGMLDITIAAPRTRRGAILASYHLFKTALKGHPVGREDLRYLRARSVKITTKPEQNVVVDGDMAGKTPVEIECVAGGLNVFLPPKKLEEQ